MQKPIHFALFLFIVTGLLFTGCGTSSDSAREESLETQGSLEESLEVEADVAPAVDSSAGSSSSSSSSETSQESAYVDGTYSQNGAYTSPAGNESVAVTLTLKGGVVESVKIGNLATNEASIKFQNLFAEGISSMVVGKPIESLGKIGAVNGSSLTPMGFNTAVEAIMADAQK